LMRRAGSHLTIASGVLIGRHGIMRAAEPAVPGVKTRNLIAHKCRVAPVLSPIDRLGYSGLHDLATMVGHVHAFARTSLMRGRLIHSGVGIHSPRPVNSKHGRVGDAMQSGEILGCASVVLRKGNG